MTISHHSHSGEFCLHAKGTLVEVIEEAIRQGFTTFGLSEHVPRYKLEHLYPEEVRSVFLKYEGRHTDLVSFRLISLLKIYLMPSPATYKKRID